jgi:endonuclease/exonuclease/phosphatase (EEP) superfamily protein YafD
MKFLLCFFILAAAYAAETPKDDQVILNLGRPSVENLPAKNLKILVWNLHKGANKDFEKDFSTLTENKNLILSQEILLNQDMTRIFSNYPDYLFVSATSFFMGKELFRTGLATASMAPAYWSGFIRTKNLEPILNSPKMALITQYPIEGRKDLLTVVNLHGINFVSSNIYREEIERIYQVIVNLKLLERPLIVAGDFNTWSEERMNIFSFFALRLFLKEATFSPDHRLTFRGFPLDHVLYSSHFILHSAKADLNYQGSDHQPLELVFSFKKSR